MSEAFESASKRFTGGTPAGKRYVGFATAHHPGTKASIPSRFETILSDNHEANGFGNRTHRFGMSENDLPGPGTYARFQLGVSTKKAATNFSSHGSAAFASAKKAGFNDDAPTTVTPGPGSYNTLASQKDFHVGGSVSFSSPVAKRPTIRPNYNPPGPGQYDVALSDRKVPCSAFSSKTPRDAVVPRASNSYLTDHHTSTFGKDDRLSASMASRTERFQKVGSKRSATAEGAQRGDLPPLMSVMAGYNVRAPAPSVLYTVAGQPKVVAETSPAEDETAVGTSPSKAKPSSMFANTAQDRFGRPTVRYTIAQPNDIGPGHYEQEHKIKRMLVSSSWALNAVPRDGIKDRYQPPGPAYYSVDKQPKRVSHRSSSQSAWSM